MWFIVERMTGDGWRPSHRAIEDGPYAGLSALGLASLVRHQGTAARVMRYEWEPVTGDVTAEEWFGPATIDALIALRRRALGLAV